MIAVLIVMLVTLVPSAQATGRIAGHVSTTGEPGQRLARAYVSLIGVDSAVRQLTMTRDDGTFVFERLAPGAYVVEAGKLPHLATSALLKVSDGQHVDGLALRLKRSGVISGQVVNEQGQLAPQVNVTAHRMRFDRGGTMSTVVTGHSAVSDRLGRFRIHGLPPGAYVVATSAGLALFETARSLTDADVDRAMQGNAGPRPIVPAHSVPFDMRTLPVYVPGVTRPEAATAFVIDDGTEHLNVTALLTASESPLTTPALASIAGSVVGPDGQPMGAQITLTHRHAYMAPGAESRRGITSASRFAFQALLPGPVRLEATAPEQNFRASMDLTISAGQISDVTLRLMPPVPIMGYATPAAPQSLGRTIVVTSLSGQVTETRVDADRDSGAFRLNLFPGRYVIESGTSVMVDGRDMTDRVIEIAHDAPIRNLIVNFSDHVQDISGRVTNSDGAGVSSVTMVAFSTVDADWFDRSRRIRIATPAADGQYQLGGAGVESLPAGEYHLAAVTGLSPDEQYNPAFLRTLVASAIRVTVVPGRRTAQDVRVR